MKKIIFLILLILNNFMFSLEKQIISELNVTLFFIDEKEDLKISLTEILKSEKIDFPHVLINFNELTNNRNMEIKKLNKDDLLYKAFTYNNKTQAISINYNNSIDENAIKNKILNISYYIFNSDGTLFSFVSKFVTSIVVNAKDNSPNYNAIPTQNFLKDQRPQNNNIVSFLTFCADTNDEDIENFLSNNNIQYEVDIIYSGSGYAKEKLYILDDISYLDINFNKILIYSNITTYPGKKRSIIESIVCTPLTNLDYIKFEDYLRENYGYSLKERLYYGKSRYYSNADLYYSNKKYEGYNSGKIFYDEITCNREKFEMNFNFTVEHKVQN